MSDTLEQLQRRKKSAGELSLMVRSMKAMAVSNITQYEMAVLSLRDYYRTISLGMYTLLKNEELGLPLLHRDKDKIINVAIVFGSDQGLVGIFNDVITIFAKNTLQSMPGEIETWAVGERIFLRLEDDGLKSTKVFNVPNSVTGITPLVNNILMNSEAYRSKNKEYNFFIFHNSPLSGEAYEPKGIQLFPPDKKWEQEIKEIKWPSKNLPQVLGDAERNLRALIREYLFVSLYKACAESLASENASRLAAMQRAEKNIDEILDDLKESYNRLRQSSIDEELFDVIAGFEALKKEI